METTPEEIYRNFIEKEVDKNTTIELFLSIIDHAEQLNNRINSLTYLDQLNIKDNKIFNLLENLLISDSNEKIRKLAAEIIDKQYIEKAIAPMRWAFNHESSLSCLVTIIRILGRINTPESKELLISKLRNTPLSSFKIPPDIDSLSGEDLAEIVVNFIIIHYLENKYDRIDFKISNGLVYDLDLSYIGSQVFKFNVLKALPNFIAELKHLERLDLKINKLSVIPKSLVNLKSLKYLDLSYNRLKMLPDTIGELRSLLRLYIRYNNLEKLPDSIGLLSSLKLLDLRKNNLKMIPESLGDIKNLESIDLHGNKLDSIPQSIASLKALKSIDLGQNHLSKLPEELKVLNGLVKLGIGGNKRLNEIPSWIKSFTSLNELLFFDSSLESIPGELGLLEPLEILDLRNNLLTKLPTTFSNLTNLKRLNLSWNQFVSLPDWIGELSSLEELNLWGNKLESLPDKMSLLSNLKVLNLNFNKIKRPNNTIRQLERAGVQVTL